MNLSFVRFAITFIIAKERARNFSTFLTLYETLLGFKLPRSMANLYRNQRGWAEVEIGVISPYANKRIITPILETVRFSPRFIGGLVSSIFATIIADAVAVKVLLVTTSVCKIIENYFVLHYIFVHTCPNFLQLQIHFKFCHRVLFYYCESMF
jgi:hypothetical protein